MRRRSLSALLVCAPFVYACSDSSAPPDALAYSIVVRFFGQPPTNNQQALFTSAAARIRAIIVGALPLVDATGANISGCTGTITPPLNETIAGLVIYASVDSIDGPGKTLAQAGPCFIRGDSVTPDYRTVIGVIKLDSADIVAYASNLQETIMHEMMHVVGFGGFWDSTRKNLIINSGTPAAAYNGPGGIAGCQAVGGTVTCASSVPVENCVGVPNCGVGLFESHWRESTFRNELMTGFLNSGPNPLSVMTIRSLEDLNYTVNTAAADAYTIFAGSLSAAADMSSSPTLSRDWERPLPVAPRPLPTVGDNSRSGR